VIEKFVRLSEIQHAEDGPLSDELAELLASHIMSIENDMPSY
jgi:hypothetical protein